MSTHTIDVNTMFDYSSHKNIPWNISQYQPTRQYLDPQQIKHQGQLKVNNYKRGPNKQIINSGKKTFFIDQLIKPLQDNPSPDKYKSLSLFDQKQNRKKSKSIKINPRLLKYTYLDWIEIKNKNRKTPSVGKYNLMKTQKQLKEQLKAFSKKKSLSTDRKRHFYDQAQTNDVPGAGNYNPHLNVQLPPKPSRKDYRWWIDKHKKTATEQNKKDRKKLAPNSYRPVSASFRTFDKLQLDFSILHKKQKKQKSNPKLGFTCSDTKFQYTRQSKIKIKQKRPDPRTYNTIIAWKGKNQDGQKNNWARCISAGPSRSIYH